MAEEGSGKTTGKVLLGCGIVAFLALMAVILATIVFGKRAYNWYQTERAEEAALAASHSQWSPPVGVKDAEAWFPDEVGPYRRKSVDQQLSVPRLHLNFEAPHARYEAPDGTGYDLAFYGGSDLEREAVRGRIDSSLEQSGFHSRFSLGEGQVSFSEGNNPRIYGFVYDTGDLVVLIWSTEKLELRDLLGDFFGAASPR